MSNQHQIELLQRFFSLSKQKGEQARTFKKDIVALLRAEYDGELDEGKTPFKTKCPEGYNELILKDSQRKEVCSMETYHPECGGCEYNPDNQYFKQTLNTP